MRDLLAIAFLMAGSATAWAETVAIEGATIYTGVGPAIEAGTVVFADGKITEVGKGVTAPKGARVIDGNGLTVVPGFINAGTDVGLTEIEEEQITHDGDEATNPVTPQMRVLDGFNPGSQYIPVIRMNGVTSVLTEPGDGNVFSGQSAVFRLDGWTTPDMLVKSPVALHINMGEPPKARYGERKTQPSTRMGIAATIRETFVKAQQYRDKWADYEKKLQTTKDPSKKPSRPDKDLKMEALLPVLAKQIPVVVRAQRMDDILTAIRLSEEFGFRMILSGGTDAYRVASTLAAKQIPVLLGPITTQPDSIEDQGAIYENAALLHKAGVKIAIRTGGHEMARNVAFEAGLAVRYGLPHDAAIEAITSEASRVLGVAEEIGSIEKGKSADLAIFEGDPLEPRSLVKRVFIAGRDILLRSYQTDLFERYRARP